eukprot:m.30701 g.30701  ORF g.30701 m.30701 type:complete len:641 (+) comp4737_c0_seq2:46-1968(+)
MHGRVKVKTTAEQQAAKEKERQKRAEKYLAVRNAIVARRSAAETRADPKLIQMTTGLLGTLPDFATMWNWRREALGATWMALDDDAKQKECVNELQFLNGCLKENPKSYSVWHQRRWVMQQAPLPPWKEELDNCNHFLKLDQRNFHCWDYRRFVVKHSTHESAEDEAEFAYTLEKISENFSNYSAWHYRSTLLPKVRPAQPDGAGESKEGTQGANTADSRLTGDEGKDSGSAGASAVAPDALAEEFETVASAFYIDPCDQSAWIYHRWLLGRVEMAPTACAIHATEAPPTRGGGGNSGGDGDASGASSITVAFSHPVQLNPLHASVCGPDGSALGNVAWRPGHGRDVDGERTADVSSVVWTVTTKDDGPGSSIPVGSTLKFADGAVQSASDLCAPASTHAVPPLGTGTFLVHGGALLKRLARYRLPSADLLKEQLDVCEELLGELDDGVEKKWALLASVYILYGLDPMAHRARIEGTLNELSSIDPNRRGYYDDVKSKYEWEWIISQAAAADSGLPAGALSMANKGLTSTHHLGLFFRVTSLDLSNNTLRRVDGLAYLQQVATLILDGNQLPGFYDGTLRSLPVLTHLSVRNNVIRSVRGLEGLRGLPALTALHLDGNPVCALPAMADFAKTHLPYLISS